MAEFIQRYNEYKDKLSCYNCGSEVPTTLVAKHIVNWHEDMELCKYCAGMFSFGDHQQLAQCFNILEQVLVDNSRHEPR